MANREPDGAVVEHVGPLLGEKGRLEDAVGEEDLVEEGRIEGVRCLRGGDPAGLFHLLSATPFHSAYVRVRAGVETSRKS